MSLRAIAAEILDLARDLGAITYGDYTLSSGQKSGYYFDGRRLTLNPRGSHLVGRAVLRMLEGSGAQAIGGPTLGADPIVTAVALTSHLAGDPIGAFIVRKESKAHGTARLIEGALEPGSRVAIVDDSCSTGASLFHAVDAAEAAGCEVALVLAVLDRNQGGSDEARRRGYRFIALLEANRAGEVTVAGALGP